MAPPSGGKTRVAVVFGGRSAEHEVSLASGRAIMAALDPGRYEVLPLLITREGRWVLLPRPDAGPGEGGEVHPPASPLRQGLAPVGEGETRAVDVFFPIVHGTFGEDGTLQGLFELAEVPFVGSGCAASAIAMDKAATKAILRAAGLPALASLTLTREDWARGAGPLLEEAAARFGFPLFVKPASLGSSVGVHRVEDAARLEAAVGDALEYDLKVLIEEEARGREIECAVLEGPAPGQLLASPLMEIRPKSPFYDYEAKYTEGMADLVIPADLDGAVAGRIRAHARAAFAALGCAGLARADFFYREKTGETYFNEVNTLPGFTPLSGYPRMIEAAGIPYPAMLDRLIACAFSRAERNRARSFRRMP